MRRFVLACLLISCAAFGAIELAAQNVPHGAGGSKVFVNPLEGQDPALANMLSAELISHLTKHGIAVVESVDDADAVLNCAGLIQTSTTEYGRTRYRIHAAVRLVNKDGAVLWADDISSSRYAQSASSSFSENVAKSLEQAMSAKQKDK
jgi:siroheme synthase (precorrin-2 oxidase/ferrochelatase)